ncbi:MULTISPECIES: type VI secretion system-associated protein TagF [unclassified Serratia (in: enterobacteria)]|uniref:type VI secretion system-associated protein TagF n=1 Tax=unclassified Serratia (in: enterobacteria) TaxID=2647522 RepID=UPI0005048F2C|nr:MULTISPECIES: type VI secretion system-associated protein TagF [unclassified Serratia (in: enterobacteria)]KFK97910.1 protein phosphatase ImpM [Serratia sp. Ag2]KFL00301.1 protein phosphatase ImpM [Serratia sp. Ag1]
MDRNLNLTMSIGWYGKIPAEGDFLQRRLPSVVINRWAHWFHNGLLNLQQEPSGSSKYPFSQAPVWNFVIPAPLGNQYVQMGCLLPARDRVGRYYPVCAMRLWNLNDWHKQQLNIASDWYSQLGHTLLHGVRNGLSAEQMDHLLLAIPELAIPAEEGGSDILSVIGLPYQPENKLAWQQAADCFEATQYSSFWWTNQADGHPLYTHVHSGNFTVQLFSLLFSPNGWSRPGGGGQYPQLFD